MPLSDILARYYPYPDEQNSWEESEAQFREFGSDWETVERLADELRRDGVFRNPILLFDLEGNEDEDHGYTRDTVAAGHHRLHAHRLTGISPVLVQKTGDDKDEVEARYVKYPFFLETDVQVDAAIFDAAYGNDEERKWDAIVESYSLPSTRFPGGWYNTDFMSMSNFKDGYGYVVTFGWEFNEPLYEAHPDEVNQEVTGLLLDRLPAGSVVLVDTVREAYED